MTPDHTSWTSPETIFFLQHDAQPREGKQSQQQCGNPKQLLKAVIH